MPLLLTIKPPFIFRQRCIKTIVPPRCYGDILLCLSDFEPHSTYSERGWRIVFEREERINIYVLKTPEIPASNPIAASSRLLS